MRRRRGALELNAEINVVSLIDVMMLLMVIFMITAPMMTGGVDVTLPSAQTKALEPKSGLTVSVTKSGDIFVDDVRMTYEQFRSTFKALAERKGEGGVYLRADRDVPYGLVMRVLSVMQVNGSPGVGLVAEPEGDS